MRHCLDPRRGLGHPPVAVLHGRGAQAAGPAARRPVAARHRRRAGLLRRARRPGLARCRRGAARRGRGRAGPARRPAGDRALRPRHPARRRPRLRGHRRDRPGRRRRGAHRRPPDRAGRRVRGDAGAGVRAGRGAAPTCWSRSAWSPTARRPASATSSSARRSTGDARVVDRFREKPDRAAAEQLVAAGALWNSGMFVWRASTLLGGGAGVRAGDAAAVLRGSPPATSTPGTARPGARSTTA